MGPTTWTSVKTRLDFYLAGFVPEVVGVSAGGIDWTPMELSKLPDASLAVLSL
jgi:hypothetical protein